MGSNGCIQNKTDRYFFIKGLGEMVEILKPDTIVNYASIPEDIFGPYKEQGIEIISLNYWVDAFRKVAK